MEKPSYILASEIQDILEGKEIPITLEHLKYLAYFVTGNQYAEFIRDVRRGDKEMTTFLSQQFNEVTKP